MTRLHTPSFLGFLKTMHVSYKPMALDSLLAGYSVNDFRPGKLGRGT